MSDCFLCSFSGQKIYEDDSVVAALPQSPAVPGHVIVFPKQHLQILEQAPDDVVGKLSLVSNQVSVAQFEGLRAQGTNIILNNGVGAGQRVAHLCFDVLPRVKDDGLGFSWSARNLSDDQLSLVESDLKDQVFRLQLKQAPDEPKESREDAGAQQVQGHGKPAERRKPQDDLFLRQLRRLP